ncbi:tetratricopeptide repeat protein [Lacunimicrobium album]
MAQDQQIQVILNAAAKEIADQNYASAINLYEQALEINEASLEPHEGLGQCYFQLENYEKAKEHFERMTRLDPRDHRPLINLGAIFNRTKQYPKAIDCLRKALQKSSRSKEAFYNLGIAYRGTGQNALALSSFREVLKMDPGQIDAHQNLANTLRDMGLLEQAQQQYQKALEIDPNFERAKRGLQQVRSMIVDNNVSASPFGRLVDEKKIRTKKERTGLKKLTPIEQAEDRRKVEELAIAIEKDGKAALSHHQDKFVPSLTAVMKGLLDGDLSTTSLMHTIEKFQSIKSEFSKEMRQLRRSVLELRAHEELMNTPDLFERSSI